MGEQLKPPSYCIAALCGAPIRVSGPFHDTEILEYPCPVGGERRPNKLRIPVLSQIALLFVSIYVNVKSANPSLCATEQRSFSRLL